MVYKPEHLKFTLFQSIAKFKPLCSAGKLIVIGIMIVILGYYMASHFTSREMYALNMVIFVLFIF